MKKCSRCGEIKSLDEFSKNKSAKSGFEYSCKKCQSEYYKHNRDTIRERQKKYQNESKEHIRSYGKSYRELNKKRISEYGKRHRDLNKDKYVEYRKTRYESNKQSVLARNKEYYNKNKSKIISKGIERQKNKRKTDPLFRMIWNLRSRLNRFCRYAMLDNKFRTMDSVGISAGDFKIYIESLFTEQMNWDNYGYGEGKWVIDHIKPLRTAKTEDDVYALNHYTNLRPMWWRSNLLKGGKWEENNSKTMSQDNSKGPGSDLKFVWWDDIGDSQEHVDQQPKATPCSNHAVQQDEDEKAQDLRWRAIMQNGPEGTHYPEYQDYLDDTDDE
jgi:hypothetical protein